MLTVKVSIRNLQPMAQGLPVLSEVLVGKEVLPPGEEREFEFTEKDDLKIKVQLTEEGKKLKKEIEEGDAAVGEEKAEGEKKEAHSSGAPPASPGPKIENPQPSHGGARDSRDVKGQEPLKK